MLPKLSPFLAVAVLTVSGLAARPASACVFNPVTCIGDYAQCHPSEAEQRAKRKQWSAEATRRLLAEARSRLRAGRVDEAAELAELLVPNVRPIRTRFSDCGPEGEIDFGAGRLTEESAFQELVAGTVLAKADRDDFGFILRDEATYSFGPDCNAEFRAAFAAFLRGAVTPAALRQAWLFLSARQRSSGNYGSTYHRLVRFDGGTRAPPVHWELQDEWLGEQVTGAMRRTAWGRSLAAAAARFWAEQAGRLGDDAQICPEAAAARETRRRAILARMVERQDMLDRRRGVKK